MYDVCMSMSMSMSMCEGEYEYEYIDIDTARGVWLYCACIYSIYVWVVCMTNQAGGELVACGRA